MKKRSRPSRHYRVIKTKKGRKRILINPKIKKKKVTRRRFGTNKLSKKFSLKKASPEELERMVIQQEEMNISRDLKELKEAEKDLDKALQEQAIEEEKFTKKLERKAKAELKELEGQQVQQQVQEQQIKVSTRNVKKKFGEFDRLMNQLERKRKDSTKVSFAEQVFGGSGKNMNEKLEDIERMARLSGDEDLIGRADEARGEFENFIFGPQRNEIMRDLEEREEKGQLSQEEKLGLQMVRLPEVKRTKMKHVVTLPQNLPDQFKDWNDFQKKNPDFILDAPTRQETQASLQKRIDEQEAFVQRLTRQDANLKEEEKKARQLQHNLRESILQDLQGKRREIAQEKGVSNRFLNQLTSKKKEIREQIKEIENKNG